MSLPVERVKAELRRRREDLDMEDGVGGKRDRSQPSRLESCLDQPIDSDSIHEVVTYGDSQLPVQHYDPDTTEPVIFGLQTLDELLSWKRSDANPFNVASVPLAVREPSLASAPRRTLVSHDMMGGYLDDRFLQGSDSEAPYAFYHWNCIDIFNYFTHVLVTIPPAGWTNAAHKHGVAVIGTFITEWTDGALMCEDFLKGEESYRAVADKLVQISHCYGFDGWLINIENTLSEVAVKNMPLFLRYLTDQMHERVSGSLVVWYDSVVDTGQLRWQNELNQSNRIFFEACDGLFTNYNWKETSLEFMSDYSAAQGRLADIYVGVDVFARGDVVAGKFETNKALEIIRKHNFSTAIFAPGWVYETQDKREFRHNQDRFWALLSDHLYIHRLASPLPFVSSFCQGFGKDVYWRGQRERKGNWFNLSAQNIQPLYFTSVENRGWLRSRGCPEDAWDGGCSLLMEGLIPQNETAPVCAKMFSAHVPLPSTSLLVLIYKASAGISVSLELKTTDASQTDTDVHQVIPLDEGHQLVRQFSELCGDLDPHGWTVRCCRLEEDGCILTEVGVSIQRDGEPQDTAFSCRIGEFMVLDAARLQTPPQLLQGLCIYDVVWLRGAGASAESSSPCLHLNATLRWDYPSEPVRHFRVYWRRLRGPDPRTPPGQLVLVARAYSNPFRVTEVAVPDPPGLLELVVEPVTTEGFLIPESHWGRRSLSYAGEHVGHK